MRRRDVIGGLSVAGMAWPLGLGAQPTSKPIFGILLVFSSESGRTFTDPIRAYLEALGFVDGRNIELDFRHADGKVGRLPMIATELVARRPAVIATFGDATGLAAQRAATVIPIVAMSEDLVQAKLVKDGANITGVSIMGTELDAKRLELLAEVLPPPAPYCSFLIQRHIASRDRLSIPLRRHSALPWRKPPLRHDRALREASARGVAGVNVLSSAFLFARRSAS